MARRSLVLVAVGSLVVAGTLGLSSATAGNAAAPAVTDRRECPHDWDPKDTLQHPRGAGASAIARMTQNVPEFNDCQRFIKDTAGTLVYDSLHAIFASDELDRVVARLDSANGHMERDVVAFAAAEIWSEGAYGDLGIKVGHNCLYLWRRARTPIAWGATMLDHSDLAESPAGPDCRGALPVAPNVPGAPLRVLPPATFPGLEDADYPPVARWDWDASSRRQYISIKCGAAWCEVGPRDGFSPSPAFPDDNPALSRAQRRVRLVKGWYDRQPLAIDADGDGKLEPSGIDGVFMPNPNLDGRDSWGAYRGRFDRTATVMLLPRGTTTLPIKYAKYLGIAAGAPLPLTAHFELCYGSGTECGVGTVFGTCQPPGRGDDPPGTGLDAQGLRRWYARVRVGASKEDFCVTRFPGHIDPATGRFHDIPGTVRWRWKAEDEGGWMRCSTGCCEKY
jgi:hypothetical protein